MVHRCAAKVITKTVTPDITCRIVIVWPVLDALIAPVRHGRIWARDTNPGQREHAIVTYVIQAQSTGAPLGIMVPQQMV